MRTKIQERDLFRVANSDGHMRPWRFPAGMFRIRLPLSAAAGFLFCRFLGVRVFEAAEIQIRQQILDPCLLLASGLRDYEIKLDRRISAARESLQLFLFGN